MNRDALDPMGFNEVNAQQSKIDNFSGKLPRQLATKENLEKEIKDINNRVRRILNEFPDPKYEDPWGTNECI